MTRRSSVCSSLGYFSSKVGLWGVWLYGFLLICLSLYATQRLPSIRDQIIKIPKLTHKGFGFGNGNGNGNSGGPTITIFSAPSPPLDKSMLGARQALAVRSWLALSPGVMVVLFGKHPSILSFAAGLGSRVSVESRIDFTFLGTPFFHSMVARSRASSSDISVMVDPEIILLPDFISTLHYAHKLEHDWLLVAMPRNVSHFPFNLDETGQHWIQEDGKQIKNRKLQEFLVQKGHWSGCSGRLLMAWNTGELPLHAGVLPPFLFRKGLHYHWVVTESLSSGFRLVFDASEVISSFYPEIVGRFPSIKASDNGDIKERLWEYRGNSHLAALYGSYYFNLANFSKSLIRFVKCDGKYLFLNIAQEIVYTFQAHLHASSTLQRASSQEKGRSSIWSGKFFELKEEKKLMACVEDSILLDRKMECSIKDSFNLSSPLYLPFSLELLLRTVADEDRSVVLAVAGNNYRDMLMSWVCRLHRLSVSNFIICAIDLEIYQFSVLQGLPVFKDPLAPTNISYNDCHFGTKCFQRVTKVKSRLVLQILRLGYNVLLSDVDVYWFGNPLPFLLSFGPAVLVAQSDEYKETGPINLPRRLNSGFYFARSDHATISAMDKVVKHALASELSEQPSFYDVLCGEGGANRLGDDRCLEPDTNLTVHFLDRNLFPNGAYQGLWEKDDVKAACVKNGCLILHNNWISGREKKLERQLLSGLWDYDSSTRLCLQDWQGTRSSSCF